MRTKVKQWFDAPINSVIRYITLCCMTIIFIILAILHFRSFMLTNAKLWFLDNESSFWAGAVFGMLAALCYFCLIDVFTPIVKYLISKICKKNDSFIDILSVK